MDKAEDFYHLAIELAKQENRTDKVVYIYDMVCFSIYFLLRSYGLKKK